MVGVEVGEIGMGRIMEIFVFMLRILNFFVCVMENYGTFLVGEIYLCFIIIILGVLCWIDKRDFRKII